MRMKNLQKKAFVFLLVYLGVLVSLNSTWVREVMHPTQTVTKIYTLLLYAPFVLAVFYKLLTDIRHIKNTVSSVSNWIFYAFALYFVALSAYRFLNGMEVKENLYYSIIFFGAVAMYMLLRDGKIYMPEKNVEKNILWIAAFFVLFRLAYCLIGTHFLNRAPININLTSGAVAILMPVIGNMLINPSTDTRKAILPWVVFCSGIVVVATTGARALFALTAVIVVAMLIVALIRRAGVLRLITAIVVGCVIVGVLAAADVGDVRYSIYRQTGINFSTSQNAGGSNVTNGSETGVTTLPSTDPTHNQTQPTELPTETPTEAPTQAPTETPTEAPTQAPTEAPTEAPVQVPTTPEPPSQVQNQDQVAAQEQIAASDWMRKNLMQQGINQVKENPWFGTGDVMYWYQVNETYGFMQSSHNFLIEAIVCYGIIGLLMIAALFVAILAEAKLFTKMALRRWNCTVALLLTIMFYFAFGFVQPTVFDLFICPLFLLTVAAYRGALHEVQ